MYRDAEPGRAQKSSREKPVGFQEMGNLRCDGCGEEFFMGHHPASVDKWIAEKHAQWLEKVLAEEHKRDKKHPDRIELPAALVATERKARHGSQVHH
jgi:hypothetical protein